VLLQVGDELGDGHAIDAAPGLPGAFSRLLRSTTTSIDGPAATGRPRQAFAVRLRTLGGGAADRCIDSCGFTGLLSDLRQIAPLTAPLATDHARHI
jgi:hypothetical protein